jgi:heavy metal-binding protein
MHADVRLAQAGPCPKCGMPLVPEGTRCAFFKHMTSSPLHLAAMVAAMVVLMAAAMMLLH